jgi:hypothetical protein
VQVAGQRLSGRRVGDLEQLVPRSTDPSQPGVSPRDAPTVGLYSVEDR